MGFVARGNATGEVLALVIIPLLDWLSLPWLLENPATWALQRLDDDSSFLFSKLRFPDSLDMIFKVPVFIRFP